MPEVGFEPTRSQTPRDFESRASTNFTTPAVSYRGSYYREEKRLLSTKKALGFIGFVDLLGFVEFIWFIRLIWLFGLFRLSRFSSRLCCLELRASKMANWEARAVDSDPFQSSLAAAVMRCCSAAVRRMKLRRELWPPQEN